MLPTTPPTQDDLADLVRRIRTVGEPKRVFLFGSCARGEFHNDSDIDVMVVVSDEVDAFKMNLDAYEALARFPYPVDVLYVNESRLARHANTPGFVYQQVLTRGQEIYAAAA